MPKFANKRPDISQPKRELEMQNQFQHHRLINPIVPDTARFEFFGVRALLVCATVLVDLKRSRLVPRSRVDIHEVKYEDGGWLYLETWDGQVHSFSSSGVAIEVRDGALVIGRSRTPKDKEEIAFI